MSLFGFLTTYIIDIISHVGYAGIFLLMTLESACMPVPSEVVMTFGGVVAQAGGMNFWLLGLTGSLGCLAGSAIAYVIGYYGGRPLLARYGKYALIDEQSLDHADRWFAKYGEAAVFISRLLPVVRTYISLPAGIARMNYKKFAVYSFIGSLPWCFALAYAGTILGKNWVALEQYWSYFDAIIITGLVVLAAYMVYKKIIKSHNLS